MKNPNFTPILEALLTFFLLEKKQCNVIIQCLYVEFFWAIFIWVIFICKPVNFQNLSIDLNKSE